MEKPQNKRKGLPKKEKKKSTALFDFLEDITVTKKNILTKDNSGKYSKFMITKFLSMHAPYLPLVDSYLNKLHGTLSNEEFHKLCLAIIPTKKIYFNYTKGAPDFNACKNELKYIVDYFNVNFNEAYEYYLIAGDKLVTNIKILYGISEI